MKRKESRVHRLSVVEICAGAGGQSVGLEAGGFEHAAAVEIDSDACATLRTNRPMWHVVEGDVRGVDGRQYRGVDLLAGGVPCPPFSIAGKQLGAQDERDLFPEALRLVDESRPRAVLLENVKGLASKRFAAYRHGLLDTLARMGYDASWRLINASCFGVPQLRPRFLLVAVNTKDAPSFLWPTGSTPAATVGETLFELMACDGWRGAASWAGRANRIAPTIVGGSKKHGGPDLGPTRARDEWRELGVNGIGIANDPPSADDPPDLIPKLTARMVARLQGFPDDWTFFGKKTSAYRQIGNAFPPPVAREVSRAIAAALIGNADVETTERQQPYLSATLAGAR